MNQKEKGRRSREERRHGGCAEGKGVTLAQQERRSGRKGPQVCKTSSVRFPARALPGKRRDWLQRQDSNLRHRGYEPRGMTASLRCGKIGEPSFSGLRCFFGRWSPHIGGPLSRFRPILREPNKCRLKSPHSNIRSTTDSGKALSVIKYLGRQGGFSEARRLAEPINHKKEGGECQHAISYAVHVPSCQRSMYRLITISIR